MSTTPPNFRPAVRAILLDDDGTFPMVHFQFPSGRSVWGLPGGGIDPGETTEGALRRELREEMGLADFVMGPHVWTRVHDWGSPTRIGDDDDSAELYTGQRDEIFLIRCPRFAPDPEIGWAQMRAENVYEIRWWGLADIAASTERFTPRDIADLVAELFSEGAPGKPIEVRA